MSAGEQGAPARVIDMWAPIVPSGEIIDDLRSGFPAEQLRYLEVFTKTAVSEEQFAHYAQALRRSDEQILAAHRPKYFAAPGAGWDALLRFGQTTIRDKVVYGTGAFLINQPYVQLCGEMRSLPVASDVLEAWLWRNAARILNPV